MGTFTHEKLNPAGTEKVDHVEGIFATALELLNEVCPPGRELALVKTKLQEACFWAKKAICETEANQEDKG